MAGEGRTRSDIPLVRLLATLETTDEALFSAAEVIAVTLEILPTTLLATLDANDEAAASSLLVAEAGIPILKVTEPSVGANDIE